MPSDSSITVTNNHDAFAAAANQTDTDNSVYTIGTGVKKSHTQAFTAASAIEELNHPALATDSIQIDEQVLSEQTPESIHYYCNKKLKQVTTINLLSSEDVSLHVRRTTTQPIRSQMKQHLGSEDGVVISDTNEQASFLTAAAAATDRQQQN